MPVHDQTVMAPVKMINTAYCPCGFRALYEDCCGQYLEGGRAAPTAETLMRSRYTAYVLGRDEYLLHTWHSSTRPAALDFAVGPPLKWLGLEILGCEAGSAQDECGTVEFVARCKQGGRATRLHETSHFVREAGVWVYRDGELHEV